MRDHEWRTLLSTARRTLGRGSNCSWDSSSWCAWTTFSSLENWLTYWQCGLPDEAELRDTSVADGGTWGQPFHYNDIAHLVIPAQFRWERVENATFTSGYKQQDIALLSRQLSELDIPHRLTPLVLEVKLY